MASVPTPSAPPHTWPRLNHVARALLDVRSTSWRCVCSDSAMRTMRSSSPGSSAWYCAKTSGDGIGPVLRIASMRVSTRRSCRACTGAESRSRSRFFATGVGLFCRDFARRHLQISPDTLPVPADRPCVVSGRGWLHQRPRGPSAQPDIKHAEHACSKSTRRRCGTLRHVQLSLGEWSVRCK